MNDIKKHIEKLTALRNSINRKSNYNVVKESFLTYIESDQNLYNIFLNGTYLGYITADWSGPQDIEYEIDTLIGRLEKRNSL